MDCLEPGKSRTAVVLLPTLSDVPTAEAAVRNILSWQTKVYGFDLCGPVADSRSRDSTRAIVAKLATQHPAGQLLSPDKGGSGAPSGWIALVQRCQAKRGAHRAHCRKLESTDACRDAPFGSVLLDFDGFSPVHANGTRLAPIRGRGESGQSLCTRSASSDDANPHL
jgi:hypothetical protein